MKRGRHQPSTIDRLEPEVKRMIADLRIEHGWTIKEIHERLLEMGQSVSRSALARHTKTVDEIGADLRHSREVAKALVEKTDGLAESQIADLNIELMHSMVLRLLTATKDGEMVSFGPEDTMFLSRALGTLASARKTDADRRRKDREEAEKTVLKAVDKVAANKASGLTKETVDAIYHAVLGVQ
ncbi:phage protein Gp27 family protein [Polymorphobacter sp.]|uniref:phage protein Gp27 family protein n=1 Tax=Polymorphobacter sp. TaxID=1909290 RepID=UPI003F70542B